MLKAILEPNDVKNNVRQLAMNFEDNEIKNSISEVYLHNQNLLKQK